MVKYIPIVTEVEAKRLEGKRADAYEMMAWISRLGGDSKLEDGYPYQGPDVVVISGRTGHGEGRVVPGMWVVKPATEGFSVYTDDEFRTLFHEAEND